jgi:TatD DNase family protein
MLDAHCHLDLYPDPSRTALNADSAGVFVVCVTNLPSAFLAAQPHVRRFKKVRLALGLHPLSADLHTDDELTRFRELVSQTSFIGEVGLDFSREGRGTKDKQLNSFRFVLQCLNKAPKFLTIHSRQAESAGQEYCEAACRDAGTEEVDAAGMWPRRFPPVVGASFPLRCLAIASKTGPNTQT